ncbi:hypothetical protein ACFS6H_07680 [Terrimonas rubra]|uniref:Uncharacterized protein n=1 Tax=Terrimonas rubra TaxID=1035890 RepID=A0ABW6A2M6_9BACT
MFERELTQKDAGNIQQILEWAYMSRVNSFDYAKIWLEEFEWCDTEIFAFYMEQIELITPKVIKEAINGSGLYLVTERLETYLSIEGGFLETYRRYQIKKLNDEKYQKLVVEELETSIKNSKRAIRQANISNWIAGISAAIAIVAIYFSLK